MFSLLCFVVPSDDYCTFSCQNIAVTPSSNTSMMEMATTIMHLDRMWKLKPKLYSSHKQIKGHHETTHLWFQLGENGSCNNHNKLRFCRLYILLITIIPSECKSSTHQEIHWLKSKKRSVLEFKSYNIYFIIKTN